MKIAVTGAAGDVGSFVTRDLIVHGHDVVAVDLRQPADADARFVQADILDFGGLVEAFADCDAMSIWPRSARPESLRRRSPFTSTPKGR